MSFAQVLRTESIGQNFGNWLDTANCLQEHSLGSVLKKKLPTPTAGHKRVSLAVNASKGNQLSPSRSIKLTN
jgi:hypothetical protein